MDRGRILHSKKSSLSCLGYVSILKATRQKQTRLVGNLSKLLLFSLHQLVTKNKYLSTNISQIFCYYHNCHQAVSFFQIVVTSMLADFWFFVIGFLFSAKCNEKKIYNVDFRVLVRQIMSALKNSKCATPSFVFRARHRRRKQATQDRRNPGCRGGGSPSPNWKIDNALAQKKSHFNLRLKSAILASFRESADWLD